MSVSHLPLCVADVATVNNRLAYMPPVHYCIREKEVPRPRMIVRQCCCCFTHVLLLLRCAPVCQTASSKCQLQNLMTGDAPTGPVKVMVSCACLQCEVDEC